MPENCREPCPQLNKLELEVRALREQGRETHEKIFNRLNAIEKTNAVQDERYENTMKKLDDISTQIASLIAKPAKRWEGLVDKAIWAVAAAVIAFLLGRVGL